MRNEELYVIIYVRACARIRRRVIDSNLQRWSLLMTKA